MGVILPYADHLVYIYFLFPQSEVSREAQLLINQKKYSLAAQSFSGTLGRRTRYIFHTSHTYLIFLILAFWVVTSANSFLGRGLVLGMCLSILVTQYFDYKELGNIDHWFEKIGLKLDKDQQKWYLILNALALAALGVFA